MCAPWPRRPTPLHATDALAVRRSSGWQLTEMEKVHECRTYRLWPADLRVDGRRRRLRSGGRAPAWHCLGTTRTTVRDSGTPLRRGASECSGEDLHLGDRDVPACCAGRAAPPRRSLRLRLRFGGFCE